MANTLAIVCLLASASLIHGCIHAQNQAKEAENGIRANEADIPLEDDDVVLPGRQLKQFGGGFFPGNTVGGGFIPGIGGIGGILNPGNPGIPGTGGSGGTKSISGVSRSCGTTFAIGSDPSPAYSVSLATKNCFIANTKAWHRNNGNVFVAGFLRACFHDCFTGFCDGSLFLNSNERNANGNENILAVTFVQDLRNTLQSRCSVKPSYADAVRLGAAAGVENVGGPRTSDKLKLGKRDSIIGENTSLLPGAAKLMSDQVALFQRVFATNDTDAINLVVTLSGAHTLGVASCDTFFLRKTRQDNTPVSPAVSTVQQLTCPSFLDGSSSQCGKLPWDLTPLSFDNAYYKAVVGNAGLLTSDQTMFSHRVCPVKNANANACGPARVQLFANNQAAFFASWVQAFLRLCNRTR